VTPLDTTSTNKKISLTLKQRSEKSLGFHCCKKNYKNRASLFRQVRQPHVSKNKGGRQSLLGQVCWGWLPPTCDVADREPVSKVQWPAVRDHELAKTHSIFYTVLHLWERTFSRWMGDLFSPKALNCVRWCGVKLEMQVDLILWVDPFLLSVSDVFLWRSCKVLGSTLFSSLKQRKQIHAFVTSSSETWEEFLYFCICVRLEGAQASVAKDLTVDEASVNSFWVGRVWGYVEVEVLGLFKDGGTDATVN
jgi:hypothetical protein